MRRTIAVVLATGLIAAAGCGDDDDNGDPAPSNTGAVTPPSTSPSDEGAGGGDGTPVALSEFRIDPATPSVKAGTVTFAVANEGSAPHALEIEGNGVESETDVLDGGESADLQVNLKPGSYEWYCPVGNHAEMGMKGKLTVE